ncbi:glycerophosphodiester phosphodiesterase [Sinomicrobium sp. M5D2P17]
MHRFAFFFLCALLVFLGCDTPGDSVLIIGHRGAKGYETENTLASVQKALDLEVDMVHIDLFRIKSGELVVFHDRRVDELTNGAGAIEEYNILDIKSLLLDGNHRIPTLQDVLKLIDRRSRLNIELRGAGMAGKVDYVLRYYIEKEGWQADDFLVSGSDRHELGELRKLNQEMPIAFITEKDPSEVVETAGLLGAVAIDAEYVTLTEENVSEVQNRGIKVFARTVNLPKDIAVIRKLGVDGIITDFPDRVR